MAKIIFSNFGQTILASPVGPSDTSITVRPGDGGKFPSPTGGDYFVMVITDDATKENHEVMHGTARAGDTITVVRAQEGTSAQNWLVGDIAQCANTAGTMAALYQQEMINTLLQTVIYPVGSLYFSAISTTNPNTILGFGTWVAVAGRVLVGYDNSQTEFDALLKTGGDKTVALTEGQGPSHYHHIINNSVGTGFSDDPTADNYVMVTINGGESWIYKLKASSVEPSIGRSGNSGDGDPHNNLQPFLVVAVWRRTA